MHSAPSVTYPVGRSRYAGALLLAGWLLGCVVAGAWWAQAGPGPLAASLACAVLAATGWLALVHWRGRVAGTLAWDGDTWSWSADGCPEQGEPQAALDLQDRMLVLWRSGAQSRWLWLERAKAPQHWDDLRRAVYSRATPEALPGPVPPAAKP
jgi:toxin CptA